MYQWYKKKFFRNYKLVLAFLVFSDLIRQEIVVLFVDID